MAEIPIVQLDKIKGHDDWSIGIGEARFYLCIECRGPEWWRFRLYEDVGKIVPRTAWVTTKRVGDLRTSRKAQALRDILEFNYKNVSRQVMELIIGLVQDNEDNWLPKKDEIKTKEPTEEEFDEKTKQKAEQLLQDPAFFYKLGKVFEWGFEIPKLNKPRFVIAEERNKRLLGPLLIGAGKLNMTSIIKVLGEIGTAKDTMLRMWLKLLPIKSVERSYMTAASLRYSKSLSDASLLYIPDTPALKGETGRQLRFMRADDGGLISEYAMKDRETGEMITKTVRVPVKGVATTSNAITGDTALESGMWTLKTDPDAQLTFDVKKEKLKLRAGKRRLFPDDELKIWQCAFDFLLSTDSEGLPIVPYAENLISILESSSTESRRDPDKFCDLISLIGYLRRFQKPKEKRLTADLVDLYFALQIGYDAITETFGELKPKELLVYETVKEHPQGTATVKFVADVTGINTRTCYDYLEKVVNKGFLNKDKEGRKNVYSIMPKKTPTKLIFGSGISLENPKQLMEFILSSFTNSPSFIQTTENNNFHQKIELVDPIYAERLTLTWNSTTPKIEVVPCADEIRNYPYPDDNVERYQPSKKNTSEQEKNHSKLIPRTNMSLDRSKTEIDKFFKDSEKPIFSSPADLDKISSAIKLDQPEEGTCIVCKKIKVLYWQLSDFEGNWGLACQDCGSSVMERLKRNG